LHVSFVLFGLLEKDQSKMKQKGVGPALLGSAKGLGGFFNLREADIKYSNHFYFFMEKDSSCVFCKIVSGEIPAYKVYEDKNYLAFLDRQPRNEGHVLIVPKNHSSDLLHASASDLQGLLPVVAKVAPAILSATNSPAFNIGINTGKESGQVVFHTHIHIIPRKSNDKAFSRDYLSPSSEEFEQMAQKIRGFM
jgi:histidine triad (HIT) family protein